MRHKLRAERGKLATEEALTPATVILSVRSGKVTLVRKTKGVRVAIVDHDKAGNDAVWGPEEEVRT